MVLRRRNGNWVSMIFVEEPPEPDSFAGPCSGAPEMEIP
jgi:hypothetical protein